MDIKGIFKLLRPLKKRMHFNNALYCLFVCLVSAGVATTTAAYVSLWIPVPFLLRFIFQGYMISAAAGVLISIFLFPGLKSLIKCADGLGLKERVVTVWQMQKDKSLIAELQRQDTRQAVSNTDFKGLYPLRFPVKLAMTLFAAIVLTSVSFTIPGFAKDTAQMIEELKNEVNEQLEELEKVKEELEKNEDLTEKELEKIREEMERLKEELKKAETEEDALKALSRTENELKKLDQQQQLHQLGEALSSNDITNDLGEAVKNGNITDMKQALEQLGQQMEQEEISPEELAEMLKQAADQLENNEILEKLQQQVVEQLASSSTESQSDVMQNLDGILSGMMQSQGSAGLGQALGQLSQALQQAKGAVSQVDSRLSTGSKSVQGGMQGGNQPGNQGNESQSGSGTGQNGMQGSGQEGQNGNQSGSGTGQPKNGEGGGGGGAGEGSTNVDAGSTGSDRSGEGRAPGERKEEYFEQLYDPDRLGGDSPPTVVNGQKQDDGQSQYSQVDNMPVQKGAILPYREVLARYKDEAVLYMEDTVIPAAMREIVREYFESLE